MRVFQHTETGDSFFPTAHAVVMGSSLLLEDQQYYRCEYPVFCSTVDVYAGVLHPECRIFLHRETVLDYKPWLYAAESILYLYMLDVHSRIEVSCVSDALTITETQPEPGRVKRCSGFCSGF